MQTEQHKKFTTDKTINETLNSKAWPMRRIRMKGFYKELGFKDKSVLSPIISNYINQCRKSRLAGNKAKFDFLANMMTDRKDLDFNSYEERKEFSCTQEMERHVMRRFGEYYHKFFDCWLECETKFGDITLNASVLSQCMKPCWTDFNKKLKKTQESTIKYIGERKIEEHEALFISPDLPNLNNFDGEQMPEN